MLLRTHGFDEEILRRRKNQNIISLLILAKTRRCKMEKKVSMNFFLKEFGEFLAKYNLSRKLIRANYDKSQSVCDYAMAIFEIIQKRLD